MLLVVILKIYWLFVIYDFYLFGLAFYISVILQFTLNQLVGASGEQFTFVIYMVDTGLVYNTVHHKEALLLR